MSSETLEMCRELAASAAHFSSCTAHPVTNMGIAGLVFVVLGIFFVLATPTVIVLNAAGYFDKESVQCGPWYSEQPRPD